jgi:hypothetical protein
MSIIKKLEAISKLNFFLFFFISILLFRAIFLNYSLSNYPWYYEWQHVEYFIDLKQNDYTFLFSHALRNQFQIFTKLSYIIFFYFSNLLWIPKIWTIILQVVPSITLSLVITFLFHHKIKSIWFMSTLIIFSIIPSSLSNFYQLSESHFYFQLLIIVTIFLVYEKFYGVKRFFYITTLFICSIFNMAAITIILFLIFICFFILKFFLKRKIKYLLYSISTFAILLFYYFISYQLAVSSIIETSSALNSSISRSLYLIFKGFFHQNNIFLGLFALLTFLSFYLRKNNPFEYFEKNNFLFLMALFSILIILSISLGKAQIYDRYKDFLQLTGLVSLYLFNELKFKKLLSYSLTIIIGLLISYNTLYFFDKLNKMHVEKKNYDKSIDQAISAYKEEKILITSEILDGKAKRFSVSIMRAVDNELF